MFDPKIYDNLISNFHDDLENCEFKKIIEATRKFLAEKQLSEIEIGVVNTYLAIALSMNPPCQELDDCLNATKTFVEDKIIKKLPPEQLIKQLHTYAQYMLNLREWRNKNPEFYKPADNKIYLISNSHSLSSAYLNLDNQYQIIPKLVWNARVYFLNQNSTALEKIVFEKTIKSLPDGARVIIQLGEVDCRINAGFFSQYLRKDYDLEFEISNSVKLYIEYLKHITAGRNFDITLANVNCLNQSIVLGFMLRQAAKSPEIAKKSEKYGAITKFFNLELEKNAQNFAKVIDIYTPTIGSLGLGNPEVYIDPCHLKPNILLDALVV